MKAIIFDFDYTLADSSAGVIKCVNYALERLQFNTVEESLIRKTIGLSLTDTYKYLTGDTDEEEAHLFSKYFVEEADRVMADNTHLFIGVREGVERLHNDDILLGIVSTKFRYRIKSILEREGIDIYFDTIVGGEDVKTHKPDPEGLITIIDKFQTNKEEVVYVGDSVVDAKTAEAAGVKFIASLTGVTKKEEFNPYNVDKFITSIKQLY